MAELQLERRTAERAREKLVPETDAEHGHVAQQTTDGVDGTRHHRRVAGAVREEDAVRPTGQYLGRAGARRHNIDNRELRQVRQDRRLDAVVDRHHTEPTVADGVRRRTRDLGREVDPVGARLGPSGGQQRGFVRRAECSRHCTRVTEMAGETTGIDAADAGDPPTNQEGRQVLVAAPTATAPRKVSNDDATTERSPALVVGCSGSVVADVRIREGDDLPRVGRVGDDLLVAGQHRVEHDLAGGNAVRRLGADRLTLEHRAVGEHQRCLADHAHTVAFWPAAPGRAVRLIVEPRHRPRPARPAAACAGPCHEACGLRTECCASDSPCRHRARPS